MGSQERGGREDGVGGQEGVEEGAVDSQEGKWERR